MAMARTCQEVSNSAAVYRAERERERETSQRGYSRIADSNGHKVRYLLAVSAGNSKLQAFFARKKERSQEPMAMMKVPLFWVMSFLLYCLMWAVERGQSYDPPFMYLLNCGAQENSTFENRQWVSDTTSHFLSSSSSISASFNGSIQSVLPPFLSTARIFASAASYSFPITPGGRYWVRLYFYPFPYQQFNPSSAVFSVTAASYTLLFETLLVEEIQSSTENTEYLFKEYSINVTTASLVITFIPSVADSSSYAFVNAIEVVSMPSDLISDDTSPLGFNSPMAIGMPYMALETVHRVNVGGPVVTPVNDTQGLFRKWLPNETFLSSSVGVESIEATVAVIKYPASSSESVAPPIVYSTALQMNFSQTANPEGLNLSWVLPIHANYQYVVRLHFCELVYATGGKRVFNVYLQNQTAYANLDLGQMFSQDQAYFMDFSFQAQGDSSLWIQAGPAPTNSSSVPFNKAILNGIEVWKLNNSHASLDGLGASEEAQSSRSILGPILGAAVGGMAALGLLLIMIFIYKRKREAEKKDNSAWVPLTLHGGDSGSSASKASAETQKSGTGSYVSSAASSLGRYFTFADLLDATHKFDESLVLGVGGFGKVYLGELDDGTKVAVKRGNRRSQQGITEFQTEIEMLSKMRHRHLVSLIGHCEEHEEMILVYEYMAKGSLRSHLYGSNLPPLSWRQRLEICIGAARGIHYLHTGAARSIIHRDVKSTNILLDDKFVAKVADFGLSKTGPSLDQTHVSTAVKGTFGYLDPEYFRRQQLTEKSDVYSLGVVLLEVLCARPAINPALPREEMNIAEWAMHWKSMGMLEQIIDPHLAGTINLQSLIKFGETAEKCLADEGIDRPAIGDVLWNLEYALQLQETSMANAMDDDSTNKVPQFRVLHAVQEEGDESAMVGGRIVQSHEEDLEGVTDSVVFSQLVNPRGR